LLLLAIQTVLNITGPPDRGVARHVHDELEATGAERSTV
jgi:hypothetical protein